MNFQEKTKTLEMGSNETLEVDKLYGPTVFANLRLTADCERGWVIERQWCDTGKWTEWCVIPAQIDREFEETDTV